MEFNVFDHEGITKVVALEGEKKVKEVSIPTPVFDALTELSQPTANGDVQRLIAEAGGWPANKQGRSGKAAALIERVTDGYSSYNGVISLLVATNEGRRRFFSFNEELKSSGSAEMLTRKPKQKEEA